MNRFLKSYAKYHTCPSCEQKVKRMSLTLGDYAFLEMFFWFCYGIAFLIVGFIVEGMGGSHIVASSISLVLVSCVAIPIYITYSSFRCNSCEKEYDISEVKSHGWF
jgi:hypothetical protein